MARATRSPTGFSFRHKFEELPLFWLYTGGEAWRGARLDGEFEVSVDSPTDWWISDLWLSLDNGKIGAAAKGNLVNLNPDDDERFYLIVLDAIDQRYASYIDERIVEECDERGLKIAVAA